MPIAPPDQQQTLRAHADVLLKHLQQHTETPEEAEFVLLLCFSEMASHLTRSVDHERIASHMETALRGFVGKVREMARLHAARAPTKEP